MLQNPPVYDVQRARPVADLPLDALLEQDEELARRWAIALIRLRPLADIGAIPLQEIAQRAPGIFAQALRAMRSEQELESLIAPTEEGDSPTGGSPASALGLASGAEGPLAAIESVEAMRGVLWDAILGELRAPSARYVADVADRLGYVCARALAAVLSGGSTVRPQSLLRDGETVVATVPPRSAPEQPPAAAPGASTSAAQAVIVDEIEFRRARAADAAAATAASAQRPLSWDESPPVRPVRREQTIEIHDQRSEQGPSAWIGSIGRQLSQYQVDRRPFSVLLVEFADAEEVRRTESSAELGRLDGLAEEALAGEVRTRGSGSLTRESAGRYWVLAPDTDRVGADEFAGRIRNAVAAAAEHRGAPLAVLVGVAVCPLDGEDAPALAAQADVGLYNARTVAAQDKLAARNGAGNGNGNHGSRRGSLLASFRSARDDGGR